MNIGIIGAGITGVTTAYFLAKKKYKVTLIESRRYPAMATSYANGGQLSASNAEAWNSWNNVIVGAKSLFVKDSPVLINPKPSISKLYWFLKFIQNIKNKGILTEDICKMAIKSIQLYDEIAQKENISFDKLSKGILHFYHNSKQTAHALRINSLYKNAGLKRLRITQEELAKIEPSLKNKKFDSIFYTKSDKTGDIHKFCTNLTNSLKKQKKIAFLNYEVKNLKEELKRFDIVILCAGINSRHLAQTIGENLNIYPVKGYSITINKPGLNSPWVSLLDDSSKIVTSRLGKNRLRVAGTAEFNGYNLDIIQHRVRPLINWCIKMFPKINTNDIKPWAGLRPMTPNMMPIVKRSINERIWYNTGHGHLGWTLSAFTAWRLAGLIKKTYN